MVGGRVWGWWVLFVAFALPSVMTYRVSQRQPLVHLPAPLAADVPASFRSAPLTFLSRASVDSLCLLPGIGPVLAARIVAARHRDGAFATWYDVAHRVTGIGMRSVARLRAASEPVANPVGYWTNDGHPPVD